MKYSQRIQELPPDERPYEKCLHSGPEKLTDSELLAVVLRSGTRGSSSVQLANEVLHLGQNEQGLLGIYHPSMEDLMQIRGIGLKHCSWLSFYRPYSFASQSFG